MNVILLNTFEHGYDPEILEKMNITVVTIRGSIALERSILGYKTIIFGNPWFKGLPGTVHIDEIKSINDFDRFNKQNDKISKDARKFLINNLSGKTFGNPFGTFGDKKNVKIFYENIRIIGENLDNAQEYN